MTAKKTAKKYFPPKCLRSSHFKIYGIPTAIRALEETNTFVNKAAADLMEMFFLMRGQPYRRRIGSEEKQVTQEHIDARLRVLVGDYSLNEVKPLLRQLYDGIKAKQNYAPTHFVRFFIQPTKGAIDKKSPVSQRAKKAGQKLQKMGVLPILPLSPGFKFWTAAMMMACSRMNSWEACNEKTIENHKAFLEGIENYKKEIRFEDLCEEWSLFSDWLTEAESDNEGGCKFKLTPRFLQRWERIYLKQMRKGKIPARHNLGPVMEALAGDKYRQLWDNGEERDYITELGDLVTSQRKAVRLSRDSAVTFPDEELSPVGTEFGHNYMSFSIDQENSHLVTLEVIGGKYQFEISKSDYFRDLIVEEAGKQSKFYNVSYRKGNVREENLAGDFKEATVRNRRSLKTGKRRLYFYMSHSIPTRFDDDLYAQFTEKGQPDFSKLYKAVTYFQCSLGNKKADTYRVYVKMGTRFLGVDIGVSRLFGFSLFELREEKPEKNPFFELPDDLGYAVCLESWVDGVEKNHKVAQEMKDWRRECLAAQRLIHYAKFLKKRDKNEEIDYKHEESLETIAGLLGIEIDPEQIIDVPLKLLDLVGQAIGALRKKYLVLKKNEVRQGRITSELFLWPECVDTYIRLLKSWTYKDKKPYQKGETNKDAFKKLKGYLARLRKDLAPKYAAVIADAAIRHKVHVVVAENLEQFGLSMKNEKDLNRVLAHWSHQKIWSMVEEQLRPYGIMVVYVDPRHTSKLDFATDEFGGRCFTSLYVMRDGKKTTTDTEKNASQNIPKKFLTRHRNVSWLLAYAVDLSDSQKKKLGIGDEKVWLPNMGLMISGALKAKHGKNSALLVEDGENYRLLPITAAQAKKFVVKRKKEEFYRHGEIWLTKEAHKARIEYLFPESKKGRKS